MTLQHPPAAAPSAMGKGTLSRQLVVRTTALVAAVSVRRSLGSDIVATVKEDW